MENILSSPFFYAVIVTVAAFVAAYGSYRTNKKINRTYEEVVAVQQKTIETKDEIIGFLTGGDSYPSILILGNKFYVSINGSCGIPNLKFEVYYLANYDKIPSIDISNYFTSKKESYSIYRIFKCDNQVFAAKTLIELSNEYFRDFLQLTTWSHGFDIDFSTPYKMWKQKIRFKFHNNKWEYISMIDELIVTNKTNTYSGSFKNVELNSTPNFPDLHEFDNKTCFSSCKFYNIEKNQFFTNRILTIDNKNAPPLLIN